MKRTILLVLIILAFIIINEKGYLTPNPTEIQGTVQIDIECSPPSGYTCKLYNCDGTWTGKQCISDFNGKCGVTNVSAGCYYFQIDNGAQTCTGSQFQYSGAFPFTYYFYCGANCVVYFG